MKKFLLSSLLTLSMGLSAQNDVTFFTEDFESATSGTKGTWSSGWFGTATSAPAARNDFMVRSATDCPTNSVTGSGNHLQIVRYASNAFSNCTYAAQTNGTYRPLIYKEIDARDYKNIRISFDWICQGQSNNDFGRLALSTDGNTFYWVDSNLLGSSTKQTKTINLSEFMDTNDITIDFTKFYIGFVFDANGSTHNGPV